MSVDCDSNDNLWISTLKDGMYLYNSRKQIFRRIDLAELFASQDAEKWDISSVFVDKDDYVWLTGGIGTVRCSFDGEKLKMNGFWPIFMPLAMSQDNEGRVWVGATFSSRSWK